MIDKYESCISLGWFCGTASAMSMSGLRCFSGPFDWCFSDLESVLKVMEIDFVDFMLKDNLEVVNDKPREFRDIKYGFYCNHDIKRSFELEYPKIFEKYNRRALRFMEVIKYPTCFFRAVRSNEEVEYIKANKDYIYNVIKKHNPNNEIVFLLLKDMADLPNDLISFRLDINYYVGEAYEMTTMFLGSKKLIKYCESNLLDKEKIAKNKKHSLSRVSNAYINYWLKKNDDSIELGLNETFSTTNQGVYVWGAGEYGLRILDYMLNRGIVVNAIIDNDDKKIGAMIKEVPIISFSEIQEKDSINIFITIASKKAVAAVTEQVHNKFQNSNILTFEKLFEYAKLLGRVP